MIKRLWNNKHLTTEQINSVLHNIMTRLSTILKIVWMNVLLIFVEFNRKRKKLITLLLALTLSFPIEFVFAQDTAEETVYCSKIEHTHTDSCYETQLICTEEHEHTEECYDKVLTCTQEEHTHSLSCYSNPEADVETQEQWEETFSSVTLTGNTSQDVVSIAKTQIGYKESTQNYQVDEDKQTIHGYTRYGAWIDEPYNEDWQTLFAAFCIHYADNSYIIDAPASDWVLDLQTTTPSLWRETTEWNPKIGDLVFFDTDEDTIADTVAIVESYTDTEITVIQGNVDRE